MFPGINFWKFPEDAIHKKKLKKGGMHPPVFGPPWAPSILKKKGGQTAIHP